MRKYKGCDVERQGIKMIQNWNYFWWMWNILNIRFSLAKVTWVIYDLYWISVHKMSRFEENYLVTEDEMFCMLWLMDLFLLLQFVPQCCCYWAPRFSFRDCSAYCSPWCPPTCSSAQGTSFLLHLGWFYIWKSKAVYETASSHAHFY